MKASAIVRPSRYTVYRRNTYTRYPNAADHNYFARKAIDVMTAIASGFGLFSAMIFLVTMI